MQNAVFAEAALFFILSQKKRISPNKGIELTIFVIFSMPPLPRYINL